MALLKETEDIEKTVGFVFSIEGFTVDALEYFKDHQIVWSDDERWLE